ncbi:PREDICTED: uncharacterized protein LOC105559608 isoform X2 [Vollenhovia emeryi]|uniref:uncharacterized protein LOC105559608 isoform X2 n=1 Tax=Vollenhovia emeryi TaxID=411798 RepID=UPI0005F5286D|nr:PREDICTED: uncharacterized protein LOC105559608 isoform X2 [Vollenhovia emeryi]
MSKMCCIVNCGSKCSNLNPNKRTLFAFPKDPHENEIWMEKVSLFLSKRNVAQKSLRICDKHFKDSDVERTFKTVLKDGIINEIPREIFKLNQGSVPCIFNIHQDNFEDECIDIKEESLSDPLHIDPHIQENEATEYNIEALKRDLEAQEHSYETIEWGKGLLPDGIVLFYCGDSEEHTRKTLVVKEDMSTEVRLWREGDKLNIMGNVRCFEDLSSILRTLRKRRVCSGPDNDTPCTRGFIESTSNRRRQRCDSCRVQRRKKIHNERRREIRLNAKQYKRKQIIKNLRQQIIHMRNYIKKNEETIKVLQSRLLHCLTTD